MVIAWIILITLTSLLIAEVVAGTAMSLRRMSPECEFVDRREHPFAFWCLIALHSITVFVGWWQGWSLLW